MKKILISILCICFSSSVYSQQRDTTLSNRNICTDTSESEIRKSVDYYTERIRNDTNDLDAYYSLGMSYYKLLEFSKAISTFDKLIEKNPCYNYALHNRALCKFFLNNKVGACEDLKRALKCSYPDMSSTREEYQKICK